MTYKLEVKKAKISNKCTQLDCAIEDYYKKRKVIKYKKNNFILTERLKSEHPDYPLFDLSSNVVETIDIINGITVHSFTHKKVSDKNGLLFYIHGGSFIAGGITRSRNVLKYLADKTKTRIVFIDYCLAPESNCLSTIYSCYTIMEHLVNDKKLTFSRNHIGIIGESSGGNIALAIAQIDNKREQMLTFQSLIYPVVDISHKSEENWSLAKYGSNLSDLTVKCILSLNGCLKSFRKYYLQNELSDQDPLVSPIYCMNMNCFPHTLLIFSEYDYLRLQNEKFVDKLLIFKPDSKIIMYKGTTHGFLDRLGFFWQSKDVIDEISQEWEKISNN